MINKLDQFSLTARLRMIAGASIILMLAYVGANFLMGTVSQRVDDRATKATENLVAASGLEKDLTSLLRDTYLMASAPTCSPGPSAGSSPSPSSRAPSASPSRCSRRAWDSL